MAHLFIACLVLWKKHSKAYCSVVSRSAGDYCPEHISANFVNTTLSREKKERKRFLTLLTANLNLFVPVCTASAQNTHPFQHLTLCVLWYLSTLYYFYNNII